MVGAGGRLDQVYQSSRLTTRMVEADEHSRGAGDGETWGKPVSVVGAVAEKVVSGFPGHLYSAGVEGGFDLFWGVDFGYKVPVSTSIPSICHAFLSPTKTPYAVTTKL